MESQEGLDRWYAVTRLLAPTELSVWDAHTHTGSADPDGFAGTLDGLLDQLDGAGQAGAVCFTMHEPDGYPGPNDRVLAEARRSGGRIVPFCRVDPGAGAVEEARRCLAAGHRGIKLHPRSDGFALSHPAVGGVMELAAEERVPVIVHAGRGTPALGRDALRFCRALPGLRLVLAHAGISDLAWIGPAAAAQANLFFDTSWYNMADLLALFAWVPPGQLLYGTDMPYGTAKLGAFLTLRAAAAVGYTAGQMESMMGAQVSRLVASREPEPCGPPPQEAWAEADVGLKRLHSHLDGALARTFAEVDASEPLELARQACAVPAGARHANVHAAIAATLEAADPRPADRARRRQTIRLLVVAAAAALTPHAPVPEV